MGTRLLTYQSVNTLLLPPREILLTQLTNLNDQLLCQVTKAKYSGVTINQTLSWHDHIINICNKANSTHAFLQRNLRKYSTNIKSRAENKYVRLIVEYASVVWSPYIKADIYYELKWFNVGLPILFLMTFLATLVLHVYSMLTKLNWESLYRTEKNKSNHHYVL